MGKRWIVALALLAAQGATAQTASAQRLVGVVSFDEATSNFRSLPDGILRRAEMEFQDPLPPSSYPVAAFRGSKTGMVVVTVEIGAGDQVLACRVKEPAADSTLTAAACPLVQKRAKFRHALLINGTPTPMSIDVEVSFDIMPPAQRDGMPVIYVPPPIAPTPGDQSQSAKPLNPESAIVRNPPRGLFRQDYAAVMLDIDASGMVTDCRIFSSSGTDAGDLYLCRKMRDVRFSPERDAQGRIDIADDHILDLQIER